MNNQPFVKTGESEIDFIIVEELFSSIEFQKFILNKVDINQDFKFISAWKSFIGKYGECDVAVEFIIDNKKIIIFIEDKIYAPEQPEQAKRYHQSGQYLIENNLVDKYITCLLSPKIYFKEDAPMKDYQYKISYEEVLDWFEKQENTERNKFKKLVITNGIERARTGYVRTIDESTNKFYNFYESVCRTDFPELEYKKPKEVASGNSWIRFNPKIFPANVTIVHKGRQGYIDLQISGVSFEEIQQNFSLNSNMSLHSTGKSVSIRIMVPAIETLNEIENPEDYDDQIRFALKSAKELYDWFVNNKNKLNNG